MERGTGLVLQPAKRQKLPSTPFHPANLPDLRSDLLDLTVFQLDRRCAAENRDCNLEAGAGLVADSVPESEYQETVNKAKTLFAAAEEAVRFASAAKKGQ